MSRDGRDELEKLESNIDDLEDAVYRINSRLDQKAYVVQEYYRIQFEHMVLIKTLKDILQNFPGKAEKFEELLSGYNRPKDES